MRRIGEGDYDGALASLVPPPEAGSLPRNGADAPVANKLRLLLLIESFLGKSDYEKALQRAKIISGSTGTNPCLSFP